MTSACWLSNMLTAICVLLTGATVGAVAGVLYAPQSGRRTRRDLQRCARRKLDEIGDMKDNVRDSASELMSGIKDNVNTCKAKTRQTIVDTGDALVEAMDGIRRMVENNTQRVEQCVRDFRN